MTSAAPHDQADPEARTSAGRVRGRREGGLAVFRGIPFAQPPDRPGPVRRPAAGDAVGRGAGRVRVRLAATAVEHLRSRSGAGRRQLADAERVDPGRRPGRPAAGHGVDLRRRLQGRLGRDPRLRRRAPGPRGRPGGGHLQLPDRHGGLRPDRGGARQPGAARPGGRAGVGPRQHRRLRRRPRPGHGVRPVGRGRVGRLAARRPAGGRTVPAGDRAERARHVLLGPAGGRHRRGHRGRARPAADRRRPVRGGPGATGRRRRRGEPQAEPVPGPVGPGGADRHPVRAGRRRRGAPGDAMAGAGGGRRPRRAR